MPQNTALSTDPTSGPTPRPRRRSAASPTAITGWRRALLLLLLMLCAASTHSFIGQPAQASQNGAVEAEATLRAIPPAAAADISRASAVLLGLGQTAPLAAALAEPVSNEVVPAIARAIAARPSGPEALLRPLIGALERASAADKPALISALGAYPAREAIRPVLALTGSDQPGPVQAAAFEALVRQTGRDDLGTDPAAWTQWWNEVQFLTEGDWRARLVDAQTSRAARLADSRTRAIDRLVDSQRRLYAATAAADRPAFLVQMMNDELPAMRRLAFELADRELLNARVLGDQVAEAALARLSDETPSLRAAAAALAGNLGRPDAIERVAEAMAVERDGVAASAMLGIAARRPSDSVVRSAIRWLGDSSPASVAAAEALLPCAGAGFVSVPTVRASVLEILRRKNAESWTSATIRLLGAIGEMQDLEQVRSLLSGRPEETRIAAAEALAMRPGELDRLIAAAASDPTLHSVAIAAIATHRPTAPGFAAASSLPAPTADRARLGRLRVAESLPPQQLLAAALTITDPGERAEVLKRIVDPGFLQAGPEPRVTTRLLILLAESRLAIDDVPGSLAALESTPLPIDALAPGNQRRAVRARALSLIRLNRIADAALLGAPAAVWLEGLTRCIDLGLEHAAGVREELEVRFGQSLTESEMAQLRELAARLAPPAGPSVSEGDAIGPEPQGVEPSAGPGAAELSGPRTESARPGQSAGADPASSPQR